MKKIITLFTFCLCAGMLMAQTPALGVKATGFIGVNKDTPAKRFHMAGDAVTETPGFAVEATGAGGTTTVNFLSALAGNGGGGFLFNQSAFMAFSPGAALTDVALDPANSLVVFGSAHPTSPGRVGIGTLTATNKLEVAGSIGATAFNVVSDKRLKSNIVSFDKGLEEVMQLEPVSYQYNGKAGTITGENHVGLLAQNLNKVAPEFVNTFTHHTIEPSSAAFNKKANVTKSEDFLSIRDNEVKYLLINAIKDQQAIIALQDERIADLEKKIENVLSQLGDDTAIIESTLDVDGTVAKLNLANPNPFRGETSISYSIPVDAQSASLNVLSMDGKLLKTIKIDSKGYGQINLDAGSSPSGTYVYQLVIDGQVIDTHKMVIQD